MRSLLLISIFVMPIGWVSEMGQRSGLSRLDVMRVNKMYKCNITMPLNYVSSSKTIGASKSILHMLLIAKMLL